jgi:glycerol kinase
MNRQQHLKSSSLNNSEPLLLVVDAGTTNIKAFLFDTNANIVAQVREPARTMQPMPGWVEQNPQELFEQTVNIIRRVGKGQESRIIAVGLTGQRESVVLWDSTTGQPLYPVINWQDTRTSDMCRDLNHVPAHRQLVRERTGLSIAPQFSASKIRWLLTMARGVGVQCGTLDTWLLYNLTNKQQYATDRTNAARTLLFNIKTLSWDDELFALFGIPQDSLPPVKPSFADFGKLDKTILGFEVPIRVVIGDQQASLYAAGTKPGTLKVTYGTGVFAMKILKEFVLHDEVLTTLAVGDSDERLYAWEASIAGAAARVSPLLHKPKELEPVLSQLALETTALLQPFIDEDTKQIIIDGGMSKDEVLIAKQAAFLEGIRIVRQPLQEGTAAGVAKFLISRLHL